MKYKLYTHHKRFLADTFTPIGLYLKLRDRFPNSILLECADYHQKENSFSFVCCQPIATFKVANGSITEQYPGDSIRVTSISPSIPATEHLRNFISAFEIEQPHTTSFTSGLFGYTAYDSVRYFEDVEIHAARNGSKAIPDMIYALYRYVIAINHFNDEMVLYEHTDQEEQSGLDSLVSFLNQRGTAQYHFSTDGIEESNLSDTAYLEMVRIGKEECKRGNLFQIVLSREFSQKFKGDEFNVYRTLRSINPSPYLFYFDYGSFKIFGSSPEAQLVIKGGEAQIHPIAGTFRRSGNDQTDHELAQKLKQDEKETAEHVMLVDLARNDLSRHCSEVTVEVFAETQFYSHVIHLVSKVTGKIKSGVHPLQVFAATFPAGTLSGAPKVRAMQIIDQRENDSRGYYGGAIGFLGFNGEVNHAIIIRSFLSKNHTLFYRAGAGVVISSMEENELQEVNNKLEALKSAIKKAEAI